MVSTEHHHRRIHRRARIIHFGLIPLALVVPFLWIYFTLDMCQEAESGFMLRLCGMLQVVPLLPAVIGVFILGLIFCELVMVGVHHYEEHQGPQRGRPPLEHAMQGYRTLSESHRRHVHLAIAQVILVSLALLTWFLFESHHTTR